MKEASGKSVVHRKAIRALGIFLCKCWLSGASALGKQGRCEIAEGPQMASEQTPEAPEASHCQVEGTGEAGTRVGLIRQHSKFTCPSLPESF